MKYKTYVRSAKRAARLVERGNYEKAIAILQNLLSTDMSNVDKAMMCLNIAIIYDKMECVEEALAWYDQGMQYESAHKRYVVAEKKAAYLAEQGRYRDSLYAYESLLRQSGLTEGDKERIEKNIATLKKRVS
jgi:tetratricopeptide (TPR) repeat protein